MRDFAFNLIDQSYLLFAELFITFFELMLNYAYPTNAYFVYPVAWFGGTMVHASKMHFGIYPIEFQEPLESEALLTLRFLMY